MRVPTQLFVNFFTKSIVIFLWEFVETVILMIADDGIMGWDGTCVKEVMPGRQWRL